MLFNAVSTSQGIIALLVFCFAYFLVITEELTALRKSKPVILASGIIWTLVAILANQYDQTAAMEIAVKNNLQEFCELLLFILVAMTYVNVMQERKVFDALRSWLVQRNFSLKQLFWITGTIAFFLSPLVDNLTTALIMCAVVTAVGMHHPKFITLACINIVIAANAGGVYSPFGDITSLMVWQNGALEFFDFFNIFIPALVSYIIPASAMSNFIPKSKPQPDHTIVTVAHGGVTVIILFALTIATAIIFRISLNLPPALGMMTGLSYLKFYSFYLKTSKVPMLIKRIGSAEWDTILFFYGIMLCVGGLAAIGYLELLANNLYNSLDMGLSSAYSATPANIILGLISAVIDNIPVMYSVLQMNPEMSKGQWLLVTLTTGIGGSLLSIGSAAGVALMGQAHGTYTFFKHLFWMPVILLGYFAGIAVHLWLNSGLF